MMRALIAAVMLAALPGFAGARSSPSKVQVVNVVAREFAYEMPDTLRAGVTIFRLRNEGREAHHLMLYALDAGHDLREVYDALAAGGPHPSWMHAVGGPNATIGSRVTEATVELAPGAYVAFCEVPSADMQIHFAKGMLRWLVVVPAAADGRALPTADDHIVLNEYGFRLAHPLTRGHHRIAITNRGTQTHELILSRLGPGRTSADFVHWIEAQDGAPPIEPWGGTTDIAPGRTIVIDVELEPGRYSFLCRVRDTGDGRPHDRHGMMLDVAVH